jgi:hypothetical protein
MNSAAAGGGGGRGRSKTRRSPASRRRTPSRRRSSSEARKTAKAKVAAAAAAEPPIPLTQLPEALRAYYGGIHVCSDTINPDLYEWLSTEANVYDLFLYCSGHITEEYLEEEFLSNDFVMLAIDATGHITAIGSMSIRERFMDLNILCVGKKKGGIGRAMVAKAIELAKSKRVKAIFLAPTDMSVGFYEKLGFKQDSPYTMMLLLQYDLLQNSPQNL